VTKVKLQKLESLVHHKRVYANKEHSRRTGFIRVTPLHLATEADETTTGNSSDVVGNTSTTVLFSLWALMVRWTSSSSDSDSSVWAQISCLNSDNLTMISMRTLTIFLLHINGHLFRWTMVNQSFLSFLPLVVMRKKLLRCGIVFLANITSSSKSM